MKNVLLFLIKPLFLISTISLFISPNFIEAQQCPEWNDCIRLVNSEGCTHTFMIYVESDEISASNSDVEIDALQYNFLLSGDGVITSAFYFGGGANYYANNGVTLDNTATSISLSYFSTTIPLNAQQLLGDIVVVTVEVSTPPSCLTFGRSGVNRIFSSALGSCMVTGDCEEIEVCTDGESVSGLVTSYSSELSSCSETENLGIEGVDVTISGSGGDCESQTTNDGAYECTLCEGGPYTICIETTCDEPCGVTDLDLVQLREILLYGPIPPYVNFMADFGGSAGFSTIDLAILQAHLQGVDFGLDHNWCRFVPVEDYDNHVNSPDSSDEDLENIDNCITITDPSQSTDFIRFMLGDINGSCSDCIHGDGIGNIPMIAVDDGLGVFEISVPHEDMLFAFTCNVDLPSGSTILSVESVLPGIKHSIREGKLYLSWIDLTEDNVGVENSDDVPLVTISYSKNSSGDNLSFAEGENLVLFENSGVSRLVRDDVLEN